MLKNTLKYTHLKPYDLEVFSLDFYFLFPTYFLTKQNLKELIFFFENHNKYQYKSHYDRKQGKRRNNPNDKGREMKNFQVSRFYLPLIFIELVMLF